MNCRINAEDPARGFTPSPGRVNKFVPPAGPGIRVDSALYDGAFVPEYYDSLVAKIAAQGLNRVEAIERMKVALTELVVEGVKTTIPVHQAILENREFVRGYYHAQFLDKMLSGWKPQAGATPEEIAAVFLALKRTMGSSSTFIPQKTEQQGRWRSRFEEPQLGRQALFVEGL
jgi:acetyl/propionyl-CoA carboxylase alpha subunit